MGSQRRWRRKGGTLQRPRWDRWREGAGRRWAEPDGRAGATGGVGCGETQLPRARLLGAGGQCGKPGLRRADRRGVGRGRGARACGVCAPVRPGPAGRRRHVEASLARVSRPVGKAGRGAAGCGRPGLGAWLSRGALERRGLPTWHLRGPTGTPSARRADPGGEGASQREAEGPGLRRGAGEMRSRYPGPGGWGGGGGRGDGGRFPPRGPPSLAPSLGSSISRRLYLNISFVRGRSWARP